ncbi:MAG TPA: glycosyltransferase family 2 protein [bacterium]|nr:glycosyltransferase family 2 protein [bacterium]
MSVILPVFNRRHLILRAIASVQRQSFTDWELLIVDDGSSDGLEELILPLLPENPNWRYLKHSRRRLAATRNIGLQAGLGFYATFIDSDDEYLEQHLQARVSYMDAHPQVDLIHGGVVLNGPEQSHWVQDAFHPQRMIHLSQCTIGATLFGKRRVFVDSGGFKRLSYSAESEFITRLAQTYSIERVEFPTYVYYTGLEDSICTQRLKQYEKDDNRSAI